MMGRSLPDAFQLRWNFPDNDRLLRRAMAQIQFCHPIQDGIHVLRPGVTCQNLGTGCLRQRSRERRFLHEPPQALFECVCVAWLEKKSAWTIDALG